MHSYWELGLPVAPTINKKVWIFPWLRAEALRSRWGFNLDCSILLFEVSEMAFLSVREGPSSRPEPGFGRLSVNWKALEYRRVIGFKGREGYLRRKDFSEVGVF